jgi:hypothetical protein
VSDVGQVVTGRVLRFLGRPGREKNADHQARLNRHFAHLLHRMRSRVFPDMQTCDVMSISNTDTTMWSPGALPACSHCCELLTFLEFVTCFVVRYLCVLGTCAVQITSMCSSAEKQRRPVWVASLPIYSRYICCILSSAFFATLNIERRPVMVPGASIQQVEHVSEHDASLHTEFFKHR